MVTVLQFPHTHEDQPFVHECAAAGQKVLQCSHILNQHDELPIKANDKALHRYTTLFLALTSG